MHDKNRYQEAFNKMDVNSQLEDRIIQRLQNDAKRKKEFSMNRKSLITIGTSFAACFLLVTGIYLNNANKNDLMPENPPITSGKMMVNIDGIVEEVSEDGLSFRIDDLWVEVNEDTEYGITGPNAVPLEEQLVSKDFVVGHIVIGYTEEDVSTGRVTALRIYNNFKGQ